MNSPNIVCLSFVVIRLPQTGRAVQCFFASERGKRINLAVSPVQRSSDETSIENKTSEFQRPFDDFLHQNCEILGHSNLVVGGRHPSESTRASKHLSSAGFINAWSISFRASARVISRTPRTD